MILGNGSTPFVPVVTPKAYDQEVNVEALFGETEGELRKKRLALLDELEFERILEEKNAELAAQKKKFLIFGLAGVAVGAAVTGSMTAFALRSYRRTGSTLGPAIYTAVGSAAMGTAMVLILSRAVGGEKVDSRVAALAMGARLAT